VRVKTTRLDTFLADRCPPDVRLALWIDAEGKAYEVLEGITGIAERLHLVHVEVETSACIGSNQKLYPEVKVLLQRLGFMELAIDHSPTLIQFNALFVRTNLSTRCCREGACGPLAVRASAPTPGERSAAAQGRNRGDSRARC